MYTQVVNFFPSMHIIIIVHHVIQLFLNFSILYIIIITHCFTTIYSVKTDNHTYTFEKKTTQSTTVQATGIPRL